MIPRRDFLGRSLAFCGALTGWRPRQPTAGPRPANRLSGPLIQPKPITGSIPLPGLLRQCHAGYQTGWGLFVNGIALCDHDPRRLDDLWEWNGNGLKLRRPGGLWAQVYIHDDLGACLDYVTSWEVWAQPEPMKYLDECLAWAWYQHHPTYEVEWHPIAVKKVSEKSEE